jgi:hypothetical protein
LLLRAAGILRAEGSEVHVEDSWRGRVTARGVGYAAGAVLAAAALAALLIPLWEMNADIDDQVALTTELVETLHAQLAATEALLALGGDLNEEALPVMEQLHDDLPTLRALTEEALPLTREVRTETLPRLHALADESLPLQQRLVAMFEESLTIQREVLEVARATLEEAREIRRRMAAFEPATAPADALE